MCVFHPAALHKITFVYSSFLSPQSPDLGPCPLGLLPDLHGIRKFVCGNHFCSMLRSQGSSYVISRGRRSDKKVNKPWAKAGSSEPLFRNGEGVIS